MQSRYVENDKEHYWREEVKNKQDCKESGVRTSRILAAL